MVDNHCRFVMGVMGCTSQSHCLYLVHRCNLTTIFLFPSRSLDGHGTPTTPTTKYYISWRWFQCPSSFTNKSLCRIYDEIWRVS